MKTTATPRPRPVPRIRQPISLGRFFGGLASYGIMGLFALMTLYPIAWLLINSFKTKTEYLTNKLGLPANPTFLNYQQAWTLGDFGQLIANSLLYTAGATAGTVFLSFLAGFALAIGMLPMLVFYLAFQKRITEGVTAGAVKG